MQRSGPSLPTTALALLVVGCQSTTAPGPDARTDPATTRDPQTGLAVSLQLAHATVRAGAGVTTTVVAQNAGKSKLTVSGGATCIATLQVQNAAGTTVGAYRVCTLELVRHTLPPGDSLTDHIAWDGRIAPGDSAAAGPGVYTLRAGVPVDGAGLVWTPPVSLTVTAP